MQLCERGVLGMGRYITISLVLLLVLAGCGVANDNEGTLTVYSGRSRELVDPLLERFAEETDIKVEVRYGNTAELAATLLEEGDNSPADVFFAQDAGGLGVLAREEMLVQLPDGILDRVEPRFRAPAGDWVGISGRARVVAYNTDRVDESELPDSILGFTDPKWKGRVGWPPTNVSFQAFVTGLRVEMGEDIARDWLEGILANEPRVYSNNTSTVDAVGRGEVDVGFVNHYYLFRFKAEHGEDFPVVNFYPKGGDPGALINVAGAAILGTSSRAEMAEELITYLLSSDAQEYFAFETYEYPLMRDARAHGEVVPLSEIDTPDMDLGNLYDLQATLNLLRKTGVLD